MEFGKRHDTSHFSAKRDFAICMSSSVCLSVPLWRWWIVITLENLGDLYGHSSSPTRSLYQKAIQATYTGRGTCKILGDTKNLTKEDPVELDSSPTLWRGISRLLGRENCSPSWAPKNAAEIPRLNADRAMHYIVQSAVLRSHVRPSVCLSITLVDQGPHKLEILETNCTGN